MEGMRCLAGLLLLLSGLRAEDAAAPASAADARREGPGDIVILDPGTKIDDPAVARKTIEKAQADVKAAKEEDAKGEALKKLGDWDHPEILKAAQRYLDDRNRFLAIAAAVVCARQSEKAKAGAALWGALKNEKRTDVVSVLLVALGRAGFTKAYKEAEFWFRKDTKEPRKGAARYFGYTKAKAAFRLLAEELDEPRPADVNSDTNPPESYWKERWHDWNGCLPHVRWALAQLVEGETFDQKKEAENWAKTEGKKHGITW